MRLLRIALAGGLLLAAAGVPALAVEPPPGSKNFEPPASVPNYFSNEAGPFRGGPGAETTYSSSGPAVVPATRPRVAAAPGRSAIHHAASSRHRVRLAHAHGRSSRHAARTRTAKPKIAALRARHAHVKHPATKLAAAKKSAVKKHPAAAKRRPASKHRTRTASR